MAGTDAGGRASPPPPSLAPSGSDGPTREERQWAMFCHLGALAGFVVAVPLAGIIVPLTLWLLRRNDYPLVDDQGKESLNFQISMIIYFIICIPAVFIFIGVLLMLMLVLFEIICVIVASIKASEGTPYRYPLCIRIY